jgi:hypothetical protein
MVRLCQIQSLSPPYAAVGLSGFQAGSGKSVEDRSPQSADRAQKQAAADKLKFNLLVDANRALASATCLD